METSSVSPQMLAVPSSLATSLAGNGLTAAAGSALLRGSIDCARNEKLHSTSSLRIFMGETAGAPPPACTDAVWGATVAADFHTASLDHCGMSSLVYTLTGCAGWLLRASRARSPSDCAPAQLRAPLAKTQIASIRSRKRLSFIDTNKTNGGRYCRACKPAACDYETVATPA